MRKNYFQNVKIADKLKMVMKAIFAILLVNNILFAILMLVFGHPVWIIIPVIAVVGMPLLSKRIIQELTETFSSSRLPPDKKYQFRDFRVPCHLRPFLSGLTVQEYFLSVPE